MRADRTRTCARVRLGVVLPEGQPGLDVVLHGKMKVSAGSGPAVVCRVADANCWVDVAGERSHPFARFGIRLSGDDARRRCLRPPAAFGVCSEYRSVGFVDWSGHCFPRSLDHAVSTRPRTQSSGMRLNKNSTLMAIRGRPAAGTWPTSFQHRTRPQAAARGSAVTRSGNGMNYDGSIMLIFRAYPRLGCPGWCRQPLPPTATRVPRRVRFRSSRASSPACGGRPR